MRAYRLTVYIADSDVRRRMADRTAVDRKRSFVDRGAAIICIGSTKGQRAITGLGEAGANALTLARKFTADPLATSIVCGPLESAIARGLTALPNTTGYGSMLVVIFPVT